MSAQIIDGLAISARVHEKTKLEVKALQEKGVAPKIVFVRVGEDPASQAYVRMKGKKAQELGILSQTYVLPLETKEEELLALIKKLNTDKAVHGILLQAPLPSHIREATVFSSISPDKDVDGFHPVNVGQLLLGDRSGFFPCTPSGVITLLSHSGVSTEGKHVVILGRGNIVGKPLAAMLIQKNKKANATVTVLHSRSREIEGHCRRADILVAAIGQPHFVKADMVKKDAVVIDVGVNRIEDKSRGSGYRLVGDVDFDEVKKIASKITPNPGGVGPMTIAMLMANTTRTASALAI